MILLKQIAWLKSFLPHTENDLEIARGEGYKQGKKDGIKEAWETAEEVSWKPSKEQMEVLLGVKAIMTMPHRNYSQGEIKAIESLYEQLKAL